MRVLFFVRLSGTTGLLHRLVRLEEGHLSFSSSLLRLVNRGSGSCAMTDRASQCDSLTSNAESAWPRPDGFRHKMTLGTGTDVGAPDKEIELAKALVRDGPVHILDTSMPPQIVPNSLEDFHDLATQVKYLRASYHGYGTCLIAEK